MELFFEYGGMKFRQKTKMHICDNSARPLCGVRSHWMEAGEPIDNKGKIRGREHLQSIHDEDNFTCQKCYKKWKQLNPITP